MRKRLCWQPLQHGSPRQSTKALFISPHGSTYLGYGHCIPLFIRTDQYIVLSCIYCRESTFDRKDCEFVSERVRKLAALKLSVLNSVMPFRVVLFPLSITVLPFIPGFSIILSTWDPCLRSSGFRCGPVLSLKIITVSGLRLGLTVLMILTLVLAL